MIKDQSLDAEGFILTGGRSSRMGEDKAALKLGEDTFIERIANTLSELVKDITLVGGNFAQQFPELHLIPDLHPHDGPLGGIHTALHSGRHPWAFVIACDLPFVTPQFLLALWQRHEGFDAVIPVQTDGRCQPLCALYARERCLPVAARLIEQGERKPRALLNSINGLFISVETPDSTEALMNINTPADYRAAVSLLEQQISS